jgi:hypothetical protein
VAEPQILTRLGAELLQPKSIAYIAKAVEREVRKAMAAGSKDSSATRKLLDQERRKLQNLVTALEGGSAAPASVLKAITDREKTIGQLERELEASTSRPTKVAFGDLTPWVAEQLGDLAGLLKEDVPRVKTELRRLNLALRFTPVEAEPRAHYVVEGQCDLSALAFSFVRRGQNGRPFRTPGYESAVVDQSGEQAGV